MKSDGMKASQSHEKRLAKVIGGTRVAGSGSFWSRKGDVRSDKYLIEHKYTSKASYGLKAEDLQKLEKEAIMVGREPLFCISLGGKNYVIQTEDDWLAMTDLT